MSKPIVAAIAALWLAGSLGWIDFEVCIGLAGTCAATKRQEAQN